MQQDNKRRRKHEDEDKEAHEGEKGTNEKKRKDIGAIRREIHGKVKVAKIEATDRREGHLASKKTKASVKATIETVNEEEEAREGAGYDKAHSSHNRFAVGGDIIFCWHCGYWMQHKPRKLRDWCDIRKASSFQRSMRDKLRRGFYR